MSVHAFHPGTGHALTVDDEALDHMRASGWMLLSEHQGNLAEQAAREAQQAAQAAQASGKAAKTENK
jgi:hypothetical protein